jgi:hypothetical protein
LSLKRLSVFFIGVAVFIVSLFWIYLNSTRLSQNNDFASDSETQSPPPPSPQLQVKVKSSTNRAVIMPNPVTSQPPVASHQPNPAYTELPQNNVIEFRLVEGFAVAYGDVILGVPEGEMKGDRGHAQVANPKTWERGEIPYGISASLPNPERVEKVIEYFRQNTSIRFVPYQGQKDAIVFEPGNEHCYSYVGRVGGVQSIKLSPECQGREILHEVLHALGFFHEQSRPDRDQYIDILWENIDEIYHSQFAKMPEGFFESIRSTPFDYHSVMLYDPTSFARAPGLITLHSKGQEPVAPVQQGLSEIDILRLHRLYGSSE